MSDGSGLPTYADVETAQRARAELRHNFATLNSDQLDIQELFRTVADRDGLVGEWNDLRQTHRKIYRESQQNAGMCSHFLKNFAEILVPLSQSPDVSIEQKRVMIGKFLETIPVHLKAARRNAELFSELAKDVEHFPRKVASALRIKAEPTGFFESVWTGIEEICMNIWQTLNKLLTKLVYVFKVALARLENLSFTCWGISVALQIRPGEQPVSSPVACRTVAHAAPSSFPQGESALAPPGGGTELTTFVGEITDDCDALGAKLTAFESAWQIIRLACSQLSADVALARSFTLTYPPIPQACDSNLRAAAMVHVPLVECLKAYSMGKAPGFM
ncbi:uncharacterized protein BXZ73DRAFT_90431 [Epithele typhae]|uniref:uncharacterized protein n=1 Tax=Epithele typhae TaxID=378194 RepID=UPI002007F7E1|nr:uncharacterized protein BXZ73DRAFT_90431 [Epithele typhae]KAH9929590.1 hypothetical protein BXZ73DRAFT_90431 [Epithele typhae]